MKRTLILGNGLEVLYKASRFVGFNWGNTPPKITLVDKSVTV